MYHHVFPIEKERVVFFKHMQVRSPDFKDHEAISRRYTCEGPNINPALDIENIPEGAGSLAIIMEDPDAPNGTWVHWVLWNIPVMNQIAENFPLGVRGKNDFGKRYYCGPCPPVGTHRYFFRIYALDCLLDLAPDSIKADLEKAMNGHIIGFGELAGLFKMGKLFLV